MRRLTLPTPYTRAQKRAKYQVAKALASGFLVKTECHECAAPDTVAHHDDYNRPLHVKWLCPKCHAQWHRGKREGLNRWTYEEMSLHNRQEALLNLLSGNGPQPPAEASL